MSNHITMNNNSDIDESVTDVTSNDSNQIIIGQNTVTKNNELNQKEPSQPTPPPEPFTKETLFKSIILLAMMAALLILGSWWVGYKVGNQQGLTATGFDADAEELAVVVSKQKKSLEAVSTALNTATQERDVAMDNAKELQESLNQSKAAEQLSQSLSTAYKEKLRERGGLSLAVQNIAISPLPNNAFEYVLDLIQVSPNNRKATGSVELRLIQGDEILVIPMQSKQFNFDDYERLTGRWTMPKDFIPQYIEVHLSGGAAGQTVERFAWQRGKAEVEMPAFIAEIPQTQATAK